MLWGTCRYSQSGNQYCSVGPLAVQWVHRLSVEHDSPPGLLPKLGDPYNCWPFQALYITALLCSHVLYQSCTLQGVMNCSGIGMYCNAGAWHVIDPWQSWIPTWEVSSRGLICPSVSPQSPPRTLGWLSLSWRGGGAGQLVPGRALPLLSTAGLLCTRSHHDQVLHVLLWLCFRSSCQCFVGCATNTRSCCTIRIC